MYFYHFLNHNSYQRFQVKATSISKLALRPTLWPCWDSVINSKLFTHTKLWTKASRITRLAIFAVFACLTSAFSINLLWVRIQKYAQQKGPDGCVDPVGTPGERGSVDSVGHTRGPDGNAGLQPGKGWIFQGEWRGRSQKCFPLKLFQRLTSFHRKPRASYAQNHYLSLCLELSVPSLSLSP